MNALQRFNLVLLMTISVLSLAGCKVTMEEVKAKVNFTCFVGIILYICIMFMAPPFVEGVRKWGTKRFKLSKQSQVKLAKWLYWIGILVIFVLSYLYLPYKPAFPSVIMLLGVTIIPFCGVIEGIKTENPMKVKAGLAQIKSFLFLIVVLFVIFLFLNGGLSIKPQI